MAWHAQAGTENTGKRAALLAQKGADNVRRIAAGPEGEKRHLETPFFEHLSAKPNKQKKKKRTFSRYYVRLLYLEFSVGLLESLLGRPDGLLHVLRFGHRRRFSRLGS